MVTTHYTYMCAISSHQFELHMLHMSPNRFFLQTNSVFNISVDDNKQGFLGHAVNSKVWCSTLNAVAIIITKDN